MLRTLPMHHDITQQHPSTGRCPVQENVNRAADFAPRLPHDAKCEVKVIGQAHVGRGGTRNGYVLSRTIHGSGLVMTRT